VAKAGEITYGKVIMELGLEVEPHLIQHHGADIVVEESKLGGEVWNWSAPHCYEDREESVVKNLKPFTNKILLTSFISETVSYRMAASFNDNPIEITELGFQILPNDYLQWAVNNKITYGVRFCNKRTDRIIKNRLLSNPKIREAIAKTKADVRQPINEIESKGAGCYVYTNTFTNPLDNKTNYSNYILDIFNKYRTYFDGFNISFGLRSLLSTVKISVKDRFSSLNNSILSVAKCPCVEVVKIQRYRYSGIMHSLRYTSSTFNLSSKFLKAWLNGGPHDLVRVINSIL
jgi:hypothetical protein